MIRPKPTPAGLAGALLGMLLCAPVFAADAPAPTPPAGGATPAAHPAKPAPRLTPGGKYPQHTMDRPRPVVVEPGTGIPSEPPAKPPSDAIVLFDGKDFTHWFTWGSGDDKGKQLEPRWKIENGYMEVTQHGGYIYTRERFGDCQLHIEWATPAVVKGNGQGRGNSGILLGDHGEIQVLDSYQNDTYPDGQAGALYGKYPPLVNACRKPGEWQCYDIFIQMARYDENRKLVEPARLTVFQNGVLIHNAVESGSRGRDFQLGLQDHYNPVRYRNIWVRPVKSSDGQ